MRMRGLHNMLSRATPSRSFSLPGSTSARVSGRRGDAAPPPAIWPPGPCHAAAEAGGVALLVGERLCRWDRPGPAAELQLAPGSAQRGDGGAPSPSNRLHTPWVRRFERSGWDRFRCEGRREGRNGKSRSRARGCEGG